MTSAFCPAHITCFFRPVHSENALERGSKGVGIRLSLGTTVRVDEIRGSTKIKINGKADDARITKYVLENMAPDRNFDVSAECSLPLGQGFGMSASGAIAAALCIAEITGKSRAEAFEAAHIAEVVCGGGLGDVSGLMYERDVPMRVKAGLPPFGRVTDCGITFETLTMVILGRKLNTARVLNDCDRVERICAAGDAAMYELIDHGTKESLFEISNRFSSETGIRGRAVEDTIRVLEERGVRSSMCMLGNSIFTEVPEEEVRDILGDRGRIIAASSTGMPASIIRKA